jgi:hypothetical protein
MFYRTVRPRGPLPFLTRGGDLLPRYNLISTLHERQFERRFALSVPQDAQRLYILRANQFVTTALATSIATNTTMLRSVLLNF